MVTFELAFVIPSLASQSHQKEIFERCGPMSYHIHISTDKEASIGSPFDITYASTTEFESATISIETEDQ